MKNRKIVNLARSITAYSKCRIWLHAFARSLTFRLSTFSFLIFIYQLIQLDAGGEDLGVGTASDVPEGLKPAAAGGDAGLEIGRSGLRRGMIKWLRLKQICFDSSHLFRQRCCGSFANHGHRFKAKMG